MGNWSCKALTAVLCASSALACGSDDPTYSSDIGSLAMKLQPIPGVQIDTLHYVITREGFSQGSEISVQGAGNTFVSTITGLPEASDYKLKLDGEAILSARNTSTDCASTNEFAIIAGITTSISVRLQCEGVSDRPDLPEAGSGSESDCPEILSVTATPDTTVVGRDVKVQADVKYSGKETLKYAWSAPVGIVSGSSTKQPSFRCTKEGKVSVVLMLSGCGPECDTETGSVTVTCNADPCADYPHKNPFCAGAGGDSAAGSGGTAGVAGSGAGGAGAGGAGSGGSGGSDSSSGGAGASGAPAGGAGAGGDPTAGAAAVGGAGSAGSETGGSAGESQPSPAGSDAAGSGGAAGNDYTPRNDYPRRNK
jgi:hypothetical protein